MSRAALGAVLLFAAQLTATADDTLVVGSKKFTESVVLGEILTGLIADADVPVRHQRELGGTRVLWAALVSGEIDLYPEYTGTLLQEVLKNERLQDAAGLPAALAAHGILMSPALGFNNTYALGITQDTASRLDISRISDLALHPDLRLGFSNEFLHRGDGWPGLSGHYRLAHKDVRGLDHDLAYRGLVAGDLQVIDVYSTDAEIDYYGLRVLADDRGYFPAYRAVVLYRQALSATHPQAVAAIARLAGRIDEATMSRLNAGAKIERRPESVLAADFLLESLGVESNAVAGSRWRDFLRYTLEHLALVAMSLGAAIVVAIPLGIVAARRPRLGQLILAATGVVQTIPSLALLVFLIPLLGIGGPPAVVALFLYSLLPIVRNTHAGLTQIPLSLLESADALGLPRATRLRLIELPLAAATIMAGIKTSAVINVGTATLAALIGAGGYGQPILTGIRLDDTGLILSGAVPAALLALAAQGVFELAERRVVPAGLRIDPHRRA